MTTDTTGRDAPQDPTYNHVKGKQWWRTATTSRSRTLDPQGPRAGQTRRVGLLDVVRARAASDDMDRTLREKGTPPNRRARHLGRALAAQVFTGLVLADLRPLAVGLSLIFGPHDGGDFSHGALVHAGAYSLRADGTHRSFLVRVVLAPLLVGAFGLVVERFLIRPLYGRSPTIRCCPFGLSLVLVEVARLIWGKDRRHPRPPPAPPAPSTSASRTSS